MNQNQGEPKQLALAWRLCLLVALLAVVLYVVGPIGLAVVALLALGSVVKRRRV